MNQKLEAISAKACSDLSALVKEAEEKILEAMHTCAEEAEDQDSHPKFRLGFTVTLDMAAHAGLLVGTTDTSPIQPTV